GAGPVHGIWVALAASALPLNTRIAKVTADNAARSTRLCVIHRCCFILFTPFTQVFDTNVQPPVLPLNVILKRSDGPDGSFVWRVVSPPPGHLTLLLNGGHAPFTIKAHRSRGPYDQTSKRLPSSVSS